MPGQAAAGAGVPSLVCSTARLIYRPRTSPELGTTYRARAASFRSQSRTQNA